MVLPLPPFDSVVTEHGPTVLRVLRGVVGSVDADDCWQETFLSALRAYPRLRPGSDVRAWLVTIAHRKAIDVFRSRSRVTPVAEPAETVPDGAVATGPAASTVASGSDVEGVADVVDALADGGLWRAVADLPEKQRLAVAYHYGADLPYSEVGRLVGCSEAAARRSAFEGVRRLRTVVQAPPPDAPDPPTAGTRAACARAVRTAATPAATPAATTEGGPS